MSFHHFVIAIAIGIYIGYIFRLGKFFRSSWRRVDKEERTALHLALLVVTCVLWPVLTPICYLELLSREQF